MPQSVSSGSRRQAHRVLHLALVIWGVASATVLVTSVVNDGREAGWPGWVELIYLIAVLVAVPALVTVGWAKVRLRKLGAVAEDEWTAATHVRSMAAGLVGVLAVQLPFFFRVDTSSVAQAKLTVAAALVTYGMARLWFNREF